MLYNSEDKYWYCTNAERLSASAAILADTSKNTAKYYEVDTKASYVVYSGAWYAL